MALYRNVQLSFWSDTKVVDDFTPEDKYFYLYLLTNPQSTISGCYEISIKQASNDLGYNKDTIENLIKRFSEVHEVVKYNKKTKEILILNWYKYNWTKSPKIEAAIKSDINKIKCKGFREYLYNVLYGDGWEEFIEDPKEESEDVEKKAKISEIINYLNEKCGTRYRESASETVRHINRRLSEGFSVDDFKTVIDKKSYEWMGTEREKYLRPQTLFGTKFESYLNQNIITNQEAQRNQWMNKWRDA